MIGANHYLSCAIAVRSQQRERNAAASGGEKRGVTSQITAAKETSFRLDIGLITVVARLLAFGIQVKWKCVSPWRWGILSS